MAFFSKRKRDEEFKKQLEREALDKMDQQGTMLLPFEYTGIGHGTGPVKSANVITAAELMGHEVVPENKAVSTGEPVTPEAIPMTRSEPAVSSVDFLYKRMTKARQQATEASVMQPEKTAAKAPVPHSEQEKSPVLAEKPAPVPAAVQSAPSAASATVKRSNHAAPEKVPEAPRHVPPKPVEKPFDLNSAIHELKSAAGILSGQSPSAAKETPPKTAAPKAAHPAPVAPLPKRPTTPVKPQATGPVPPRDLPDSEQIAHSIDNDISNLEKAQTASAEQRRKTLLDRCNAYLADDNVSTAGRDTARYKLESVESILSDFEDRATKRALKHLNINLPDRTLEKKEPKPAEPPVKSNNRPEDTAEITVRRVVREAQLENHKEKTPTAPQEDVKHISFGNPTAPQSVVQKMHHLSNDANNNQAATQHIDIQPISMKTAQAPEPPTGQTQVFKKFNTAAAASANTKPEPEEKTESAAEDSTSAPTADYRTIGDKDAVEAALFSAGKRIHLRTAANAVLFLSALLCTTLLAAPLKAMGALVYFAVHFGISLLAIVCNLSVLKGIPALFTKKQSMDTAAALCSIAVAVHTLALLINGQIETAPPLSMLSTLSLLFYSMGRCAAHRRITGNFAQIANDQRKNALHIVHNRAANLAMGQRTMGDDILTCCGSQTKNITDFLKYSYCKDPLVGRAKKISQVGLIMAVGLFIASLIISGNNFTYALFIFAAVCCLAAAPATLLITNLPLKMAAKRINCYGAMLTGYKACADLDHCNAVAVTAEQLFPEDSVRMIDMRPLSPNPIDKTILDAYSVAAQIGSPLAGMFKQINNMTDIKPKKADTVMYEEKMGISGWVDNHRVFIGNRVLMETHGFHAIPPLELDKKILRKGYFPVYLACDNAVCAIFVVKYLPNEEIAYELSRICNTGTTVLVKNCDPNLSEKMLCDYFGLYEESIGIMSKQGSDSYELATAYQESRSAGAAFSRSVCGLFSAVTAAIHIKSLYSMMSALYVISVILGILAAAVLLFASSSFLTPLHILCYQLIATVIVCLPAYFKRP